MKITTHLSQSRCRRNLVKCFPARVGTLCLSRPGVHCHPRRICDSGILRLSCTLSLPVTTRLLAWWGLRGKFHPDKPPIFHDKRLSIWDGRVLRETVSLCPINSFLCDPATNTFACTSCSVLAPHPRLLNPLSSSGFLDPRPYYGLV